MAPKAEPTVRIGLLGLGTMGRQHLAGYAGIPGIQVLTRESEPFHRFGPDDREALYAAMINDPTLDALDLCLPTPLHARLSIAALHAGKHVLCEKPMALNCSDCEAMRKAAEATGCILMIAHVLRFAPPYQLLAEAVRSARYGALAHLEFTRSSGYPQWAPWLSDPAQSGGAVLDLLVHDFDQALAIAGQPTQIAAWQLASADSVHCEWNVDHAATVQSVAITGGWFAADRAFAMGFRARFHQADLIYADNRVSLHRPGAEPRELPLQAVDMYTEQQKYFVQCCRSGQQPELGSASSAARAVALAITVRQLAHTRGDATSSSGRSRSI